MITCTITFDSRIVAAATATDEMSARSAAWSQVSDLPLPELAARCDFHFFPEIMIETAAPTSAKPMRALNTFLVN